jgi:hypothetical protein
MAEPITYINPGYQILVLIFSILINSFLLELISKHFKFKNQHYRYAFFVATIFTFSNLFLEIIIKEQFYFLLLPFTYLIAVYLIKYFYKKKWKESFIFGCLWFVIGIFLNFLTNLITKLFGFYFQ